MLLGKKLGPFHVERQLGSGAMGAVYRARDERDGEPVAVKIIGAGLAQNEIALHRFQRECAILKQMDHPNVARYIASGRFDGTPFYVMEFIEGESLDRVLARRGRITWEEMVALGKQLCAALQHAHEKGIIHRDLKPSNVMVRTDGSIKLTDFGIAKDTDVTALTAANSTLGTAAYMSPEQCRGERHLTGKADLYSMGVMFYELLTGQKPYTADNPMDMFALHTSAPIPRPSGMAMDIPIWLDTLVAQLMEKKPEHRPLDAAKVAEVLEGIEQKVIEQKSAGMDRAVKRRVDRTTLDTRLDEEDKDAARILLGKKKKKRRVPFYRKAWFTALAVAMVLGVFGTLFWLLLFKPPSPDKLLARAQAKMSASDLTTRKEARDPLDLFLRHYPGHADAAKVRELRDEIERQSCEFYLERDRQAPDDPAIVWMAYGEEKRGNLEMALKLWRMAMEMRDSTDPLKRGWGATAAQHAKDIDRANEFARDIKFKLIDMKDIQPSDDFQAQAVSALRAEFEKQDAKAILIWDDLKKATKARDEQRYLYLLALSKLRKP
jgi:serine/threonine-protein kinase